MMGNKNAKPGKNEEKNSGRKSAVMNFLYNYFNIAIFLAVALVLIPGFMFLIIPKYSKINDSISVMKEAREKERNDMRDYYEKLNLYRTNYDSISEADKNRVNTMLPRGNEVESIIAEMENLIVNKGMLLKSLKVTTDKKAPVQAQRGAVPSPEEKKPGNIGTITIQADIAGVNYRGLKLLMDTFESNLRILDINDLDFSPDSETVTLKIFTYYLKTND